MSDRAGQTAAGQASSAEGLVVADDMLVTITYQLYDAAGELQDQLPPDEPLTFVVGYAQVLPGLDSGVLGACVGERRELRLGPNDAFGDRDEQAVLEIDRGEFPEAAEIHVGDELIASGPDGGEAAFRVAALTEELIIADLNHPLAGQDVRFVVEVLELRPASDEELEAAHVELEEATAEATLFDGSPPPNHDAASQLVQLRTEPTQREQAQTEPTGVSLAAASNETTRNEP